MASTDPCEGSRMGSSPIRHPKVMKYQYCIVSRWRNRDAVLNLVNKLREKGKTVYNFFEGDGTDYELKSKEEKHDPDTFMQNFESISDWQNSLAVREIFEIDMNALKNSESVILLLPAGKSAHIEIGAAYGLGKQCILIGEQKETESLYMIFSKFYKNTEEFIKDIS